MRSIAQPGPAPAERIQCVPAAGFPFKAILPAGINLLEAVRQAFAEQGFTSGVINLVSGGLFPFAYVIPGLSKTPEHAAFYSETFRPPGITRVETGAMTFGTRDDIPFFHCHALWTESDGTTRCGHILPEETIIAAPIHIGAIGLQGATFAAEPDPETNFKLFGPIPTGVASNVTKKFFALRLRPHQDICGGLEDFCKNRGIRAARLHGGVGSIVGARFTDGQVVDAFATEMAITAGHIVPAPGGELQAELDVVLIDYTGALAQGRLVRGDNPILITLEIVLEAIDPPRL